MGMIPHPWQQKFIECPNKIKLAFTGNRAGKSITGLVFETIWECMGIHPLQKAGIYPPPPIKARIIEPTLSTGIEKFILPLLKDTLGVDWHAGKYDVKYHRYIFPFTHSELDFMSSDQEIDQFGAVEKDLVWIDEPTRRDIWNESLMRVVSKAGRVVFTMTPVFDNPYTPWIFQDLYMNAKPYGAHTESDMVRFQWGLRDNLNPDGSRRIKESEVEVITKGMTTDQKAIVLDGEWRQLSGLILPRFDETFNVIERRNVPGDLVFFEAIDWHPRKDIYVLWVGVDRQGNKYVTDSLICNGSIAEIAIQILNKRKGKRIARSVIDWLSNMQQRTENDGIGQNPRTLLRKYGINSKNVTKDNQFKIRLVQEAFAVNKKKLRSDTMVADDQQHVIKQLRAWHWSEHFRNAELKEQKQTPVKLDDDFCDCLGYILMEKPNYSMIESAYMIPQRDPNDVLGYHTKWVQGEYDGVDSEGYSWEMTKMGWERRSI